MSNLITSMCGDCKYVKYSFDGGSTKCGYRGKKDCNFIPREKKDLAKDREIIKSEAIKEFAERLKGYAIGENGSKEKAYFFVEVQDIDNLVKEMTEVQK